MNLCEKACAMVYGNATGRGAVLSTRVCMFVQASHTQDTDPDAVTIGLLCETCGVTTTGYPG